MTLTPNTIQPFRIDIAQTDLDDLRARLARTRWPELPEAGWSRGVPVTYLRRLAKYWAQSYDWRQHEAALNELPQFMTTIDGQRIHFLHLRSPGPDAVPLVLLHGWPNSYLEFVDVVGPLSDPRAHGHRGRGYHVVVPCLPGFGFSSPLTETGWNTDRMATAILELMERLGYSLYWVHGGDTGAYVASAMGRQATDRIVGVHLNALVTYPLGADGEREGLTDAELQRLTAAEATNDGYMQIQAKSPYTLAFGLHDSPAAQLAWIIEMFQRLCDLPDDGLPEDAVDIDWLLTNATLYWLTGAGGSAAQVYYEDLTANSWDTGTNDWENITDSGDFEPTEASEWSPEPNTVPTGVLVATCRDISIRRFAEREHNIVRWSEYDKGGHFFAMEQPATFIDDIRDFFETLQ